MAHFVQGAWGDSVVETNTSILILHLNELSRGERSRILDALSTVVQIRMHLMAEHCPFDPSASLVRDRIDEHLPGERMSECDRLSSDIVIISFTNLLIVRCKHRSVSCLSLQRERRAEQKRDGGRIGCG